MMGHRHVFLFNEEGDVQQAEWQRLRNILVVRLDNVGDMVLMSPALRAIRATAPDARVTLLASPAGAAVAPMLPVHDVIVHSAAWMDLRPSPPDERRQAELIAKLRARAFDAAFIFTSFSQSPWPAAFVCYMAGIPLRVGHSKERGGALLSHWSLPPGDGGHQADRNMALLEVNGIRCEERRLSLMLPAAAVGAGRRALSARGIRPGDRYVVVAPGASCAARRYAAGRFAEVTDLLAAEGHRVIVAGAERERDLVEAVAGSRGVAMAGAFGIAEMAAVIADAALLVANDSGPMHIADAVGTPMVILYSGTELESQWEPHTAAHVLLRRPTPCAPCHAFECAYDMECLDIPPAEVLEHAGRLVWPPVERETAQVPA